MSHALDLLGHHGDRARRRDGGLEDRTGHRPARISAAARPSSVTRPSATSSLARVRESPSSRASAASTRSPARPSGTTTTLGYRHLRGDARSTSSGERFRRHRREPSRATPRQVRRMIVIAANVRAMSATLNTGQWVRCRKSTTWPRNGAGSRRMRSVRLPSAPPSSSPSPSAQPRSRSRRGQPQDGDDDDDRDDAEHERNPVPVLKAAPALRVSVSQKTCGNERDRRAVVEPRDGQRPWWPGRAPRRTRRRPRRDPPPRRRSGPVRARDSATFLALLARHAQRGAREGHQAALADRVRRTTRSGRRCPARAGRGPSRSAAAAHAGSRRATSPRRARGWWSRRRPGRCRRCRRRHAGDPAAPCAERSSSLRSRTRSSSSSARTAFFSAVVHGFSSARTARVVFGMPGQ